MGDCRYEFLIAYHEITEIALCRLAGVTEEQIDGYDFAYDENRSEDDPMEPGDNPDAPYHKQHVNATLQEKRMAEQLGVDWDEYEAKIAELMGLK